jgi:hypothetical protein
VSLKLVFPVLCITFTSVILLSLNTLTNLVWPDADALTIVSVKLGNTSKDVKCDAGFQLIFKIQDHLPACVKPQTIQKLVERGWGMIEVVPIPKLSQEHAFQIVKSDLLKHVPTLDRILHYGDPSPSPDFKKYPLYLIFEDSYGIQFRINSTDYSLMVIWDPKETNGPISDDHRIQLIKSKLVYVTAADAYAKDMYLATNYFVDALNGNIVYSDLLENISAQNKTADYKP